MSVVAAETQTVLRARVRDYLRDNGTLAPTAVIRRRVTTAFENLEHFLRAADPTRAARRAWPAEWSLHEIADHVLESRFPLVVHGRLLSRCGPLVCKLIIHDLY